MSAQANNNAAPQKARATAKSEAAPKELKLHPDLQTKVTIAKDSAVGEYGLINFYTQAPIPLTGFVISHPIGATDLPKTTFVVNRLKDVHILKSRIADPEWGRIQAKRNELRLSTLVDKKILEVKDGKHLLTSITPFPGKEIEEAFANAKARRSEAQKEHQEKVAKMKLRRGQKKPAFTDRLEKFFSPDEFKLNTQLEAALVEAKYEENAAQQFPSKHRTLLDDDVPQKELQLSGVFTPDLSLTQAMDKIQAEVWKYLTLKPNATEGVGKEMAFWKEKALELEKEKTQLRSQHDLELKNLENRDGVILMKNHDISKLTEEIRSLREQLTALIEENQTLRNQLLEDEEEEGGL